MAGADDIAAAVTSDGTKYEFWIPSEAGHGQKNAQQQYRYCITPNTSQRQLRDSAYGSDEGFSDARSPSSDHVIEKPDTTAPFTKHEHPRSQSIGSIPRQNPRQEEVNGKVPDAGPLLVKKLLRFDIPHQPTAEAERRSIAGPSGISTTPNFSYPRQRPEPQSQMRMNDHVGDWPESPQEQDSPEESEYERSGRWAPAYVPQRMERGNKFDERVRGVYLRDDERWKPYGPPGKYRAAEDNRPRQSTAPYDGRKFTPPMALDDRRATPPTASTDRKVTPPTALRSPPAGPNVSLAAYRAVSARSTQAQIKAHESAMAHARKVAQACEAERESGRGGEGQAEAGKKVMDGLRKLLKKMS